MKYLLRKCEMFADANVGKFHFTFCAAEYFTMPRNEALFHMLVLVGTVKLSDQVVGKMMGL